MAKTTVAPALDASIDIKATPRVVLDAFFDAAALVPWLRTVRSVTIPRTLGPYALEWPTSEDRDEVLGKLGGVLRGTVIQIEPTRGFDRAAGFWPPRAR